MNNTTKNSSTKNRISSLNNGKIKKLTFFEEVSLRIAGLNDGKRGLPKENENGNWTSPYLDKEIRSFDEFTSRMFGQLQIEKEKDYARLGELMDSVAHIKSQLNTAKLDLNTASDKEKAIAPTRKFGEDKLTDAQVASRRSNEQSKALVSLNKNISSQQTQLKATIDEFIQLRNKIIEDNNSTRMICNRVKDHLHMRIITYWNYALRKHPESNKMPSVPVINISLNAEDIYMNPHNALMDQADLISQTLPNEKDDK